MYTLYRQVGELQCLVLKAQLQQAVGLFGWGGDQRPEGSQSGHVEIPKVSQPISRHGILPCWA